ncbi:cytochrome P450 2D18 [Decorospora gaudefroyi]|uniref:Cytochrome P450 2D18 n=1 Tax=Decorospora gaudefroyi TaxID=184978 RepID=A0A6A5K3T0_9PLEO|nr:cytochrome P450 2D18 [Decorospora gaudefroyi]
MSGAALAVLATLVLGLICLLKIGRREAGLPPGPPTKPIVGNLHHIPIRNAHFQFTTWAKQYGGIYSLKLFHATAVVITDRRLVRGLVDKKGAIYSSRPDFFFARRYVSRDPANIPLVVFLPFGDKLRLCRKLLAQQFNEARVEQQCLPIIEAEATQMLFDFWKRPDDFMMHPLRLTHSVIMTVTYGIRVKHHDGLHEYSEMLEDYVKLIEPSALPPVDLIPWLEYVPQSLWSGSWKNWKSKADESGKAVNAIFTKLAIPVLERRERGVRIESVYDSLLDQWEKGIDLTRRDLDNFAGSLVDAGSDTSSSALRAVIQAMAKYPDIQQRAHKNIDEVVGAARSPQWKDSARLPFIVQIIKETLRWRPIITFMPHATTADDTVNGYFIPKNTTVFLNIWGLNRTPSGPNDSDANMSEFDPDRYANRTHSSPHYAASPEFESRDHYSYGAGRRLCPGIHLAERTLFVAVAKLLWAFEFKEKPGTPIDVDPRTGYTEGAVRSPKPFECEILVRKGRESIIEREFADARDVLGKFENDVV